MAIYTIADLHLSFNTDKPMDIFGTNWKDYEEKIKQDWMAKVTENDLVVLPGDFSWAMYLEETSKDFEFINKLPGKKILLKGNHDYWWTTVTNMKNYIKKQGFTNIDFLHNNSYLFDDKIICGTKGWNISEDEEDIRLTIREEQRLELSIKTGIEHFGKDKEIIVFIHYPPVIKNNLNTGYISIMKKYGIKRCYYGHLHGNSINDAVEGNVNGIELKLVSADGVNFKLIKI